MTAHTPQRITARRVATVSLALITTVAVAAACGSSSKGSNGTDGSASSDSGSTISIGIAAAETGPSASAYQQAPGAAEAWAKSINASGGINGHQVKVLARDSKGDPREALTIANEFISDHVAAVVIEDTVAESAMGKPLLAAGVPVIGGTANDLTANTTLPNFFTLSTTNPAQAASPILAAKAVGATKVAGVVCAEVPVCAQADKLYASTAKAQGLTYLGIAKAAAADPSYSAQCLSLKDKGADFIALALASSTVNKLVRDCTKQKYDGWFGAYGAGVVPSAYKSIPNLKLAGGIHAFPWWATDSPAVKKFDDAMKKYNANGDYQNPTATSTWVALELFQKVVGGISGSITAKAVTTAYGKVHDETLDGLLPQPITFTPGKPASPVDCFWAYKAQNNVFQTITLGSSGNGQTGSLQSTCYKA